MTARNPEAVPGPLLALVLEGYIAPAWHEDGHEVGLQYTVTAATARPLNPLVPQGIGSQLLVEACQNYIDAQADPERAARSLVDGAARLEAAKIADEAARAVLAEAPERDLTAGMSVAQLIDRTKIRRCEDHHGPDGGAGYHLDLALGADDTRSFGVVLTDDEDTLVDLRNYVAIGSAAAQVLHARGEA